MNKKQHLLFVLLLSFTAGLALLQVLALDATGTATAQRRLQREVNVLLAVQTNDERRDVHDLLAHTAENIKKRTNIKNEPW